MNTAELVKETKTEDIEKSIRMGRRMGNNDEAIFHALLTEYGSDFTQAELKQIMKQTS